MVVEIQTDKAIVYVRTEINIKIDILRALGLNPQNNVQREKCSVVDGKDTP
ncbi:MAG: hypothetical protein ABDH16_01070 [Thermodesulfovibrionaceae bacterium]